MKIEMQYIKQRGGKLLFRPKDVEKVLGISKSVFYNRYQPQLIKLCSTGKVNDTRSDVHYDLNDLLSKTPLAEVINKVDKCQLMARKSSRKINKYREYAKTKRARSRAYKD